MKQASQSYWLPRNHYEIIGFLIFDHVKSKKLIAKRSVASFSGVNKRYILLSRGFLVRILVFGHSLFPNMFPGKLYSLNSFDAKNSSHNATYGDTILRSQTTSNFDFFASQISYYCPDLLKVSETSSAHKYENGKFEFTAPSQ